VSDEIFTIIPIVMEDPDGDEIIPGATGFPVDFNDIWITDSSQPGELIGRIRWPYPSADTYNVIFTANDGRGGIAEQAVRIEITAAGNHPPVLWEVGPRSGLEGGMFSVRVKATDIDGDGIVITATGLPTGFELITYDIHDKAGLPPGYVEYRIRAPYTETAQGSYQVYLKATDEHGAIDEETITITIDLPVDAPILETFELDTYYDFLVDTIPDDAMVVFQAHANAASYRIVPYYGPTLGEGPELDIPNSDIVVMPNGTLNYTWVDYQVGYPEEVIGISMRYVNAAGNPSDKSSKRYMPIPKSVIYGRVTDASGDPISGAMLHTDQVKNSTGEVEDCSNYFTDADGYYFIKYMKYDLGDGDPGRVVINVYKDGYQPSLSNEVILTEGEQIQRKDVTLTP